MAEIARIDALGGALAAIQRGYFQKELAREQVERNRALETGERKLVGQNFAVREERKRAIDIFRLDEETERRQIERLHALKDERDALKVAETLDAVREAAIDGSNLVPPILEAVKVYATQGEICDVLRGVFGTYSPDTLTSGV
jgi:methylmalonyl-CoA mutase N-terminal domain/subunit